MWLSTGFHRRFAARRAREPAVSALLLRRRGLPDPLLVVSHGAPGMIRAIARIEPVLALHLILLPVNVIRLIEARPITLPASLAKVSAATRRHRPVH